MRATMLVLALAAFALNGRSGEFVLLGEERLRRLALDVEIEGRPSAALWDEAFGALHSHLDRDGSGSLDATEAARLPSPFGLRQVGGGTPRLAGPAPPWKHLDADDDGKVSRAELAAFYRRHGLSGPLVVAGETPSTQPLTAALLDHLDTDHDGTLSEAEVRRTEAVLLKADRNADERIAPTELVPTAVYPGTSGTVPLGPPRVFVRPPGVVASLPLAYLPAGEGDLWADALAGRPGVALGADSLRRWRAESAAEAWTVRFDGASPELLRRVGGKAMPSEDGWLSLRWAGNVWRLRADRGKRDDGLAAERKQLLAHFAAADTDANGLLSAKELDNPSIPTLGLIQSWADRNGDGTLSRTELDAWFTLTEKLTRGAATVTLLDHGQGLFEILDANHDSWLSVREMRAAWDNLKASGCVRGEAVDLKRLPRTLTACVSRGPPHELLPTRPPRGPDWFRAMDRNNDGDVSRREFVGTDEDFRRADRDGDGLLDAAEAERIAPGKD